MHKVSMKEADFLEEGERLLWKGEPKPFHITEGAEGHEVTFVWLVCLIWLVLLSLYSVYHGLKLLLLIFFIGLICWMALSPLAIYFRILRQQYFITDRRALVVESGGNSFFMDLSEIDRYRICTGEAGGATLVMGDELLAENGKQLRYRALHPLKSKGDNGELYTSGIVFYHTGSVDAAARAIDRMKQQ